MQKAADASKRTYDLRRRDERFTRGQKVWKRNMVLSDAAKNFSAKLAPRFVGPFIVRKVVSPWTYSLEDESGNECGVYHAKDLKSHPPDPLDDK
nr:unnamed protein product [Callosobruchus analis]CAI5860214.1 unnamed protein product [Callosobruchus analis]